MRLRLACLDDRSRRACCRYGRQASTGAASRTSPRTRPQRHCGRTAPGTGMPWATRRPSGPRVAAAAEHLPCAHTVTGLDGERDENVPRVALVRRDHVVVLPLGRASPRRPNTCREPPRELGYRRSASVGDQRGGGTALGEDARGCPSDTPAPAPRRRDQHERGRCKQEPEPCTSSRSRRPDGRDHTRSRTAERARRARSAGFAEANLRRAARRGASAAAQ